MEKLGQCFRDAGTFLLSVGANYPNGYMELVHGLPLLRADNLPFSHAWVEDPENVYSPVDGKIYVVEKAVYYKAAGGVETRPMFRYTREELLAKALLTGHWGPWDLDYHR